MARIMIGSTIPAYKAADRHLPESLSWLKSAEALIDHTEDAGHEVWYFATLETDGRGLDPFKDVIDRLEAVGEYWTFSIDLGDDDITSRTRLPRICAGRNLLQERALMDENTTHLLFLDSDMLVPLDAVTRLLAVNRPLAGGNVPVYCQTGPIVMEPNVQEHWNTAGFLMVNREVFRAVRWGIDPDAGRTDDPHYQHIARALGYGNTWVDHDLIGKHRPHTPGPLPPMEKREHNRKYYR